MTRSFASFTATRLLGGIHVLLVGGTLSVGIGCVEQAEEKPTTEDVDFVKKNILATAPTPQFAANADLDGKVVYLGLDVSTNPIEPGKDVKLVHYWKVISPPGAGWRLFTHFNGPNKAGYSNVDHGPVRGKYPVSQWKAGDIIRDEHGIRLPATWQYDKVEIYVGLWRGAERMTVKSGPKDNDGRVLAASIPVKAKVVATPIKRYVVRKTAKAPKLDGKLDESAWKDTPSAGSFVNTMTGGPTEARTEVKMLWDAQNLYVGFDNADADVWSTLNKRDDKLWTQEAVELMIDADNNGKSYVELQVAPNGNIFDTYLPEYRKYEDTFDPKRKPYDWNSKMKVVVKVDGTLNKRDDQDKGWVVELALPLADANGLGTGARIPPEYGDVWRVNMFRLDSPQGKPQQASAWSPPMVGDFHALDRFGEILFADEKGQVPPAPVAKGAADPHAGMAAIKQALGGIPGPHGAGGDLTIEGRKAPASKKLKGDSDNKR